MISRPVAPAAVDPGSLGLVALAIPTLAGGGAERMILTLAGEFTRRGVNVDLVLVNRSGPHAGSVPEGVRVLELLGEPNASVPVLRALPALARYIRRERPRVLLSALNAMNVAAVLAGQMSGADTRIVVSQRNPIRVDPEFTPWGRFRGRILRTLARYCYQRADGIVAISHGVSRDLSEFLSIPAERIDVIHNPAWHDEYVERAQAPAPHPWLHDDGIPTFLAVGRLHQQKDFPSLLQAFARVRAQHEARLIVLGEGPERPRLEAMIETLGLGDSVTLFGFSDNPLAFMARARALVVSSRWEGFGNILVEALGLGTQVVSTDAPGGPREILDDGRYGQLVPVGDVAALAGAMNNILTTEGPDRDLLRRRGQDFSVARAADRYMAVCATAGHPHA